MCGRFINLTKTNSIKKKFNIKSSLSKDIISYNISPSQNYYILFKDNEINLDLANWGYSFIDKKDNLKKNIINSRLETIRDKVFFRDSFSKRKCLIPLNGYYEWSLRINKKTPFFIHIPQSEPMYLAGIWKYINFKKDNAKAFTIITKNSNQQIKEIHQRMPILLSVEEGEQYLNDDSSSFLQNDFTSTLESELDFYQVSKFVNNPLNDSKECIKSF